jgi:hypothetical protein
MDTTDRTLAKVSEDELSWVSLAVAEAIRVAELAAIALIALLVSPPLMILAVVVIIPAIALTALAGLIACIVALPVFVIRHLHRRRPSRARSS